MIFSKSRSGFKRAIMLLAILLPLYSFCQDNLKLWYKKPAKVWTEALPIGNGRLGAMVFGGVKQELLQLNEATLWTGGPVRTNVNPGAYANLLLAREALLKDEDYAKAYEYEKKMHSYKVLCVELALQHFGLNKTLQLVTVPKSESP